MYYDPAPPVRADVLQRVARQLGDVAAGNTPPPLPEADDDDGGDGSGLLLHLAATPEDVMRAYPPPPAQLAVDDGAAATPEKQQQREEDRAAQKRPRSLPPDSRQATAAERQSKDKDEKASSLSSSFTPHVQFDPSFVRTDYLGRSFLQPPPSLLAALESREQECRPPRQMKGGWGKHAAGIQQLQWVPPVGHLLFAADLKGEVRLYEAMASRRCIATFVAHTQPVKSLEVTPDAAVMSTGSVDGTVALWDVERGVCRDVLTNAEGLPCVQHLHHPFDTAALILAALDRKIVLYDVRASAQKYQREYTGHMGTIFNLSLLSGGRKLLTTAEDKTLRTWDFRVPVQIKQIADVSMHAITHVVHHPTEDMLVAQSLNNQALVFADSGGGQVKLLRHRVFSGHTISGTRCQLAFSPDGRFLSSGDIHGKLFIWSWATSELVRSFPAHTQTLASHLWHPTEPSRVVTSAWDGTIKNWG
ncbi:Pre-mRNA-processing factor 17 [Trypanosoma conorhini]|uniref:Pre-mRNA-processing factor 17 n=1 Tax=Trypanosoma conorhini TaxID=83891 RepID=A0A3R7PPV6_9TRYP|nr:Pre-mRNA-processing factor 17 [Trypanosoma conorhini]RNF23304.1 Pre-mRNA-processing factor 17 [Trypanosoma conorhini]